MNVFLFNAALLCEECGWKAREALKVKPGWSFDEELTVWIAPDGTRYDYLGYVEGVMGSNTDVFPFGPEPNGGGEADCPNHCDECHVHLENPLTGEGRMYVLDAVVEFVASGRGNNEVIREWCDFYDVSLDEVFTHVHGARKKDAAEEVSNLESVG